MFSLLLVRRSILVALAVSVAAILAPAPSNAVEVTCGATRFTVVFSPGLTTDPLPQKMIVAGKSTSCFGDIEGNRASFVAKLTLGPMTCDSGSITATGLARVTWSGAKSWGIVTISQTDAVTFSLDGSFFDGMFVGKNISAALIATSPSPGLDPGLTCSDHPLKKIWLIGASPFVIS